MGQIDKGIANYCYSCIPHTGGSRPSYKGGGGGEGGGSHPDPQLRGGGRPVSKKFFFGPSGLSQFALKIRGAPPPGSASVPCKTSCIVVVFILSLPQPSCTFIFMVHVSLQNLQVYLLAKHQQVLPPQNLVLHFPRLADFPLCVQYSGK